MKGIYKITNLINNKCYIGKSQNIQERWKYHKVRICDKRYFEKPLYRAFRKYGLENFSFEVIEEIQDDTLLNEREKHWIKFYHSYGSTGYNATEGGDGGQTSIVSKLTSEDVKNIRIEYAKCNSTAADIYPLYQHKISKRGFQAVWIGENWKKIMPEVYTEENKNKHTLLNRQREGKIRKGEIVNG